MQSSFLMTAQGLSAGRDNVIHQVYINGDHSTVTFENNKPSSNSKAYPIIFNVPNYIPSFGESRKSMLNQIHSTLFGIKKNKELPTITVINGIHGIGKSQLVRKYSHQCKAEFKNACRWIDATTPDSLLNGFQELAKDLSIGETNKLLMIKAVYQRLNLLEKILIIFDNATSEEELKGFMPSAGVEQSKFFIIITTVNLVGWSLYPKLTMRCEDDNIKKDSKQYIYERLIEKEKNLSQENANDLAKILGYHPLAIAQAVAYIMQNPFSNTFEYIRLFKQHKEKKKLLNCPTSEMDYNGTVYVTFSLALEAIGKLDSNAAEVLNIISYLYHQHINANLFKHFFKDEVNSVRNIFFLLQSFAMIDFMGTESHFNIHELVQSVSRVKIERESSTANKWKGIASASNLIRNSFSNQRDNIDTLKLSHELLHHAKKVLAHSMRLKWEKDDIAYLNHQIGVFYLNTSYDIRKAKKHLQEADKLNKALGVTNRQQGETLRQLFKSYLQNGINSNKPKIKKENFKQAMECLLRIEKLKVVDDFILSCDFANLYLWKLEYFENKSIQDSLNKNSYPESDNSPKTKNKIIISTQKSYEQLVKKTKEHLDAAKQRLDENNHSQKAMLLHYYGTYYLRIGKYTEAIKEYKQALEIKKKLGDKREIARTCNNLAKACFRLSRTKEYHTQKSKLLENAEGYLREALLAQLKFFKTSIYFEIVETLKTLAEVIEARKLKNYIDISIKCRMLIANILNNLKRSDIKNDEKLIELLEQSGNKKQAIKYIDSIKNDPSKKSSKKKKTLTRKEKLSHRYPNLYDRKNQSHISKKQKVSESYLTDDCSIEKIIDCLEFKLSQEDRDNLILPNFDNLYLHKGNNMLSDLIKQVEENRKMHFTLLEKQKKLLQSISVQYMLDYEILCQYSTSSIQIDDEYYSEKLAIFDITRRLLINQQELIKFESQIDAHLKNATNTNSNKTNNEYHCVLRGQKIFFQPIDVSGDGWCTLWAAGVENPEAAIEELINNWNNPKISHYLNDAIYNHSNSGEELNILGVDDKGENITAKLKEFKRAFASSKNGDFSLESTYRGYLGKKEVIQAYLRYVLSTRYAPPQLAEAWLSLHGKQLFLMRDYGSTDGKLAVLAPEHIQIKDSDVIFIIQKYHPNPQCCHYNTAKIQRIEIINQLSPMAVDSFETENKEEASNLKPSSSNQNKDITQSSPMEIDGKNETSNLDSSSNSQKTHELDGGSDFSYKKHKSKVIQEDHPLTEISAEFNQLTGDQYWEELKLPLLRKNISNEERKLMIEKIETAVKMRDVVDYRIYHQAVDELFPSDFYNVATKVEGKVQHRKDNTPFFISSWYVFIVTKKNQNSVPTGLEKNVQCKIKINAPGSRTLTSDIDTSISASIEYSDEKKSAIPFHLQATFFEKTFLKVKGPDFVGRVPNFIISRFYSLSVQEFFATSFEHRDSNAYLDTTTHDDAEFSKFNDNEINNPVIMGKNLWDTEEYKIEFLKFKKNKHQQEQAASLFLLRLALDNENRMEVDEKQYDSIQWNNFKQNVLRQCAKTLKKYFQHNSESEEIEEYINKITQDLEGIFLKVDKLFNTYKKELKLEDKITSMNNLYVKYLEEMIDINDKIILKREEIKNLTGESEQLKNEYDALAAKKQRLEKNVDIKDLLEDQIKAYDTTLSALDTQMEHKRTCLKTALENIAQFKNDRQESCIKALLFANEAYTSRYAVDHIVKGMQIKDDIAITEQTIMGSALQQIGFKLLHSEALRNKINSKGEKQYQEGEVAYYTAKYGYRVFNLIFHDEVKIENKIHVRRSEKPVANSDIDILLEGFGGNTLNILYDLKSNQIKQRAYLTFTNEELYLLNSEAIIASVKKSPGAEHEKTSKATTLLRERLKQIRSIQDESDVNLIHYVKEKEVSLYLSIAAKIIALTYASRIERKKALWGELIPQPLNSTSSSIAAKTETSFAAAANAFFTSSSQQATTSSSAIGNYPRQIHEKLKGKNLKLKQTSSSHTNQTNRECIADEDIVSEQNLVFPGGQP